MKPDIIYSKMNNVYSDNRGITGLETAIILNSVHRGSGSICFYRDDDWPFQH